MPVVVQLMGRALTDPQAIEAQKKKIQRVINENLDIKAAIDAAVGRKRPRTEKALDAARTNAIRAAIKKNLAFAKALRDAVRSR